MLLAFMGWITFFDILQGQRPVAMASSTSRRGGDPSAVEVGGVASAAPPVSSSVDDEYGHGQMPTPRPFQ